jgi:hypothetical protein
VHLQRGASQALPDAARAREEAAQLRAVQALDLCASEWTHYKYKRSNSLKLIDPSTKSIKESRLDELS